jgi:hypothetical protein
MVDIDDAFEAVAAAIRARGAAPEEVLTGLEMLRGSVGRWLAGASGAVSAPAHGRWLVTPTGRHIDLSRRPTLRKLVTALVEGRIARPGEAIPSSELVAAGWADDPTDHEAAMNRLRVAICRLRQLGLENAIVTTGSGWMLDPDTPIIREGALAATSSSEPTGGEPSMRRPISGIFEAEPVDLSRAREEKVA